MIKVVTSSGGIMELYAPITAECITNEFPGHALFRSPNLFSQPLVPNQHLQAGQLYYLLPFTSTKTPIPQSDGHSYSNTRPAKSKSLDDYDNSSASGSGVYRMCLDKDNYKQTGQGRILKRSEADVVPRYNSTGVWKVKLVISPEQLSEILSHESRTEALIESVRTVAKCGNGVS
ncbi:hypothetical protein NMG60_11022654 [Bertholletia excelsa]